MKPTVGRIVHYVSHGTPVKPDGTQQFTKQCRAAIVTEVDHAAAERTGRQAVGLAVLNPAGLFFHSLSDGGSGYDPGGETPGDPHCQDSWAHGNPRRYCPCGWIEASYEGGTWHWPERQEED
jgi:hypothetical protein